MRRIDYAAQVARGFVGCPYVFASTGQTCTPSLRKNRASAKPTYADAIYKYCPVLSGKKSSCAGCKYEGKRAFDCRGLTYIACKEAGLKISSIGATSQYNADDWIEKGLIADMPANTPCLLFKQSSSDPKTMQHTGFNLGDGYTVDCRGHSAGTVLKETSSYKWTHYAIPKGSYDEIDAPEAAPESSSGTRATIRKGSEGADVKAMQEALLKLGYTLPKYGADGDFGNETLTAVKAFQAANNLTVDGICGAATWNRIDALLNATESAPEAPLPDTPATTFSVTIHGLDAAAASYLLECYPGAIATESVG